MHSAVEIRDQRIFHVEYSRWITLYAGYYSITNEKWMLCEGSKNMLSSSDVHGPSQHMSYDMRAI